MHSLKTNMGEARTAEARRELADKLATVGTIAAGIGHDLANQLNVALSAIETIARLAREERPDALAAKLAPGVSLARESLTGMVELVRALVAATRPSETVLDISDVLDDAIKLTDFQIRERASLVRDYERGARVLADRARLTQVVVRLLVNAAQAIDSGKASTNTISVLARREGSSVVVEVSDTGKGIPADIRARIFEPFFSTKAADAGTGLGLYLSAEIVRALGGSITFRSREGRGTIFRVSLPSADTLDLTPAPPSAVTRVRRHGALLVVDDDSTIGAFLRHCAATEYRVDSYSDADYALARVRAGIDYDLVFCAAHVSGAAASMSAIEFRDAVHGIARALADRVVIVLGPSDPEPSARGACVLRRPLTIGAVRALLHDRVSVVATP